MKKYLLLALVSLLSPFVAEANTPKVGHYQGTAVDFHKVVHRKISFDVSFANGHYYIRHLHVAPNTFEASAHHVGGFAQDHRTFKFDVRDIADIQFKGHGTWEEDTKVAGDFRERVGHSPSNVYYTWHAHWKHD